MEEQNTTNPAIETLFKVGAHFGQVKSRRHPSAAQYIYGIKDKVDIFDLEKTSKLLDEAKKYIANIATTSGQILFIGGKNEAKQAISRYAQSIGMPFVSGRWIGGTFTNFPEIKKRVNRLETLRSEREKGDFAKYTKKERLLLDREIANLERYFAGIISMKELPKAVFVVDVKKEHIAVTEARTLKIPVISISSSDCDFGNVNVPISANDASVATIEHVLSEIVSAYKSGKKV
jgi:small subunit ribosomal protein S2